MSKNWIRLLGGMLLWLGCQTAWAQVDSLLRQADRILSYKAYGRAIDAYSQLLMDAGTKLTPSQKATVQGKLAYAYKQVGDGKKAEQYYREAISKSDPNAQLTLEFAQVLATNGKYPESEKQYARYLQLKEADTRQKAPSALVELAGQSDTRKVPTRYRLELLALNTAGEEFSPTFYRDGLVYVAGSKGGAAIETKGRGGGSGYLDLFYVPNRNDLKIASIIQPDGTVTKPKNESVKTERTIGSDARTRATSNDSPTPPNFEASINITEGLKSDDQLDNKSKRFSKTLNTKYHEGPATFSPDGSLIIFTRNNYNEGQSGKSNEGISKLKLYTAYQQRGAWTRVEEMPFNNDEYSVGHPTLSRDGQLLFFASDMPGGMGGTDLYVSRYQHGQWSKPVNLGGTVNTAGNELFPFVDDSGNLYFSSDGREGLGGLDIYFAALTNGTSPQSVEHLDAPINSPTDDFGFITDKNRRGGYFSSDRRNGNDDIYRFVRENSLYGCRNLSIRVYDTKSGMPLDSTNLIVKIRAEGRPNQLLTTDRNGFARICLESNNDFMIQSSRDGYISNTVGFTMRAVSDDRPSRLEIGMIKPTVIVDTIAPNPTLNITTAKILNSRVWGIVISERTRRPIAGVTVRLTNDCDKSLHEYITGPDGRYVFNLAEDCDYVLTASKTAFGTNMNKIKKLPKKTRPRELSADLRMIGVGDVVTIDNIYYDLDRYSLRPDAARELDKVVITLRKYPSLVIEIRSHTDSRGDAQHNKVLSEERAMAVANYLASKGISRRRISAIGMGESQLVNNCTDGVICTEAEHQRNRRTEFRVVEIK